MHTDTYTVYGQEVHTIHLTHYIQPVASITVFVCRFTQTHIYLDDLLQDVLKADISQHSVQDVSYHSVVH